MQFNLSQIQAMGSGEFFGAGNAQLPTEPMLMFDVITDINSQGGKYQQGFAAARLNILPEHWFFGCHFKDDPVMPGCLGLDALWQLLGVFLGATGAHGRGRAIGVGKVKFRGQIYPDAKQIEYHLHVKRIFTKPLPLAIADGEVRLAGEAIYEAQDLKVGMIQQKNLRK